MTSLAAGTRFGHYDILGLLAAGGMGEVYSARDTRLGRQAAIKVMNPGVLSDPDGLARFEREAGAASRLNHPNIVTVYEIGHVASLTYIAMELVDGRTLRALLAEGRLPANRILDIGRQMAEGLAKAHEAGIVHRDFKPDNVMVTADGLAKILDFGVAKVHGDSGLTNQSTTRGVAFSHPAALVGTLAYMSPEQGRGAAVDFRTDQFCFGLVLYEMLTGSHPFHRPTSVQTLAAIIDDEPRPLDVNLTRLRPLVRIVERCLAKQPEDRYGATRDLAHDLRDLERRLSKTEAAAVPIVRPRVKSRAAGNAIAVLPFANTSGDPNAEYLSDGLTENLINRFAQIPTLQVTARSSVFRYKGRDVDPRRLGLELNVATILSGRIAVRDDQISVGAELVNVQDGTQIWGGQYELQLAALPTIEQEICAQIADTLQLRLTAGQRKHLRGKRTTSSEAYQLHLKGRHYWNKRTPADIKKGLEHFQLAVEVDPGFAPAHAGIADCYTVLGSGEYSLVRPHDALPRARGAALRAIELYERLAEAHTALGFVRFVYEWNWPAAEASFLRAVELNPEHAMAHSWYSEVLTVQQRFDDAQREAARALDIDPVSVIAMSYVIRASYYARRYDAALQEIRRALELDPTFARLYLLLAPVYFQLGRADEAIAAVQKTIELAGNNPFVLGVLGDLYARTGRRDDASRILAEITEVSKHRYVSPYNMARIYIGLEDHDRAFDFLQQACEERSSWLVWINVSPFFDGPIRQDARFPALLRQIGLIA